ncbi:hypothetical protein [Tolypothrix sp. VBCCA 56010]|uniref:hypothetical protein n=1 Tax=Tolypothrix sp. VBCCA 56010 TaxID=3137731 RepID=UPI003D7D927E
MQSLNVLLILVSEGYLTLPPSVIAELGLPYLSAQAILDKHRIQYWDVYQHS